MLDPVPISVFLALVFTAGGLVELLARGPVPAGYQQDGPALIILTVASGLSLAILWWSPLASLVVAVTLVCAQAVAGYEYTMAAIGAVVVASFATVAFDQWKRSVAASVVVVAGFVLTILVLPSATWQEIVTTWVSFSIVWVVAIVIRIYRGSIERAERRAALFAADREARAREAVAEERARLARELHDSVGHALNVVVLHAGAAQRIIEKKPELAREALELHRDGRPPGAGRHRAHARHPARPRGGGVLRRHAGHEPARDPVRPGPRGRPAGRAGRGG